MDLHYLPQHGSKRDNMKKILFSLVSSLLFLSLAFFPLIEAETNNEVKKDVTVEIHTPQGIETLTKKLSRDKIEELSYLIENNDIDELLSVLQEYGLLAGFSQNDVKTLITGGFDTSKIAEKKFEELLRKLSNDNNFFVNALCLFSTSGLSVSAIPSNVVPWLIFWYLVLFSGSLSFSWEMIDTVFRYASYLGYIPRVTTAALWVVQSRKPYLTDGPRVAKVDTLGILGRKNVSVTKTASVCAFTIGFTGIIITIDYDWLIRHAVGFSLFATGCKLKE